ncbi:hypothetical protein EPUS_02733 [Endocarpon pusillum Z07020]|uniref:Uncharacterized protein n=1 Tax=Endocarpon pusillum (strain Z07020 / HMAS-L-300199) TaxID=1263415 RepID=U1FU29_ENDPU|nr:uncharacterized protein EPUS_02733 [Endocarpon pusillum Z07020]ERF68277.1 hypothetical protein EPUS_02733 [Endocarpon pusillum Z07020]
MDIGEADSAGNDGIGTSSSSSPKVAPNHVWAKIEAIESSNRARLRLPPSLRPGLLADGRLLTHSEKEVDDDNDIDEHEGSDVKSRFVPEMVEDPPEEANESSNSHKYESGYSHPIRMPASLEDELQEAEEGTMLHTNESGCSKVAKSSGRRQDQFAEAGEDTYSDEYETESPEDRLMEAGGDAYFDEYESDDSEPVHSSDPGDGRHQGSGDAEPVQIPQSSTSQSQDNSATILSRNDLTEQVLDYLQHSMLEDVYGDLLSHPRRLRYEPKWPRESGNAEAILRQPKSRAEANAKFEELVGPLRGWHKLSENKNPTETLLLQEKINSILSQHRQKQCALPPLEICSGDFLLYHNLPDAVKEVTVWSLINSAHNAIRRENWVAAVGLATKAIRFANPLKYAPLVSKCWFWRGMAMDGLVAAKKTSRKEAAECFLEAMRCIGIYQEGELLKEAAAEYKFELLDLLEEQRGQDEWSQHLGRLLTGIDGWFQPEGKIQPRPSPPLVPQDCWPEDTIWADIDPDDWSLASQASSEEQLDEYLDQLSRYADPKWFSSGSLRQRNVDWAIVSRVEEVAQRSTYIKKEMLYQLCRGLSPAFEQMVQAETFTEGFDNYPDIEESIAWKILNYTRVKARLKRPIAPLREELTPTDMSVTTVDDSAELDPQSLPDESRANGGPNVEKSFRVRHGGLNRGHQLTISTNNFNEPGPSHGTPTGMRKRMLRVCITAEEKIAAFQHNLLDEENEGQGRSKVRLELENNPQWQYAIKTLEAHFDQHVQQEMAASKVGLSSAQDMVTCRNEDYLRSTWGDEGVRPPTPALTRQAREQRLQERRLVNERSLKRFNVEMEYMTYQRKCGIYARLPKERQECIAEPKRPSDTRIDWFEQEVEKMRVGSVTSHGLTLTTVDGSHSRERLATIGGSEADEAGTESRGQDHIHHISPLRPQQRSWQPSPTRIGDESSDEDDAPIDSISSAGGEVNPQAHTEVDSLLDQPNTRQLKAKLGIDAMTEAMQKALLKDQVISLEDLVLVGESAIGATLSRSNSLCSPALERDSIWDEDTDGVRLDPSQVKAIPETRTKEVMAPEGNIPMFQDNVPALRSGVFQTKPLTTSIFQSQAVNTENNPQPQAPTSNIFGLPPLSITFGSSTPSNAAPSQTAPPKNIFGLPSVNTSMFGAAATSGTFPNQPSATSNIFPTQPPTTTSIFPSQPPTTTSIFQSQPTTTSNIFGAQATSTSIFDTAVDFNQPATLSTTFQNPFANLIKQAPQVPSAGDDLNDRNDADDEGEDNTRKVEKQAEVEEDVKGVQLHRQALNSVDELDDGEGADNEKEDEDEDDIRKAQEGVDRIGGSYIEEQKEEDTISETET